MGIRPSRENNFSWLLGALVLILFCSALVNQLQLSGARVLINISLIVTVILVVWSMETSRDSWFKLKVGVSVLLLGLMLLDSAYNFVELAPFQLLGMFVFFTITIQIAWGQVMFTGNVSRNSILGAICIYFLIGLWFTFAYMIVEYFFPNSFRGLDSEFWQQDLGAFSFYSMVTLTTLGYGDITPVAEHARTLAWFEALLGQLYLAVMVAGFVAVHISENMRKTRGDPPAGG